MSATSEDPRIVPMGSPITTEQATRAVLRLLKTPMIGDIEKDSGPGYTLQRLRKDDVYRVLSQGEKRLVDIAYAIWRASDTEGASIGVIGGLDKDNRRKVLIILFYLHLGRDLNVEVPHVEWARMFMDRGQ